VGLIFLSSPTAPPPKPVRALGPAIVVVLIIIAASLGFYQIVVYPPNHTTTTTVIVPPDPHNVTVTIVGDPVNCSPNCVGKTYVPDTITVVIGYNATVIWTNNDTGVEHTVTASTNDSSLDPRFTVFGPTSPQSSWNNILSGQSVNFTFIKPGTYVYSCSYHPWMVGSVIVKAGSNSTSSSTVSSAATTSSSSILVPNSLSWFMISEGQIALLWITIAFLSSALIIWKKNPTKLGIFCFARNTRIY
jgi:plastocyanin